MIYDELTEKLILYFTAERYQNDVAIAKKDFFDEAGIMDEEANSLFELRMTQFLEWYLFTRGLHGVNLTPAQYALQISDFKMTEAERPFYENLANVRHGLFEFIKVRADDIYVKDLFLSKKLIIRNSPIRIGFNRDEIFDVRLIPHEDTFVFTKGFCFHPAEAGKFIWGEIKRLRKTDSSQHEAFMLRLMKMRYKYEQYRHLKLEYVYTNERKVRF